MKARHGAIWHPSPNFGERRGGAVPELVVLHYTAMRDAAAALDRLCDPDHEVSAHYLIGRHGELWQLVAEENRAWHAGRGQWRGRGDINSRSIGIEIDNDGRSPFSEPAVARLEHLLDAILAERRLAPGAVIGHSDLAPERKFDPGPRFDWRRLACQQLALWPGMPASPAVPSSAVFCDLACRFGYPPAPLADLMAAVRSRFRPGADGALDEKDMAIVSDLARRFPAPPIDPSVAKT